MAITADEYTTRMDELDKLISNATRYVGNVTGKFKVGGQKKLNSYLDERASLLGQLDAGQVSGLYKGGVEVTPENINDLNSKYGVNGTDVLPDGTIAAPPALNPDGTVSTPDYTPGVTGGATSDSVTGSTSPTTGTAPQWNLESDPIYLSAIQGAQNQFNLARINALGNLQYQETGINRELSNRKTTAEESRRRLAGNYAARGMGGGRAGALTRAEAQANARELSNRTSLREQLAELKRQYSANYGAEGSDWLGTMAGQQARESAVQQALQVLIPKYTSIGA